jgi:hypothetical protein
VKNKPLTSNLSNSGPKQKNWGKVALALILALLLAAPPVKNQVQHSLPTYAEGDDRPKLGAGG